MILSFTKHVSILLLFTLMLAPAIIYQSSYGQSTDTTTNVMDIVSGSVLEQFPGTLSDITGSVARDDLPSVTVTYTNEQVLVFLNSTENSLAAGDLTRLTFVITDGDSGSNGGTAVFVDSPGDGLVINYTPTSAAFFGTETFSYVVTDPAVDTNRSGSANILFTVAEPANSFATAIENITVDVPRTNLPTHTTSILLDTTEKIRAISNAQGNDISNDDLPSLIFTVMSPGSEGGTAQFTGGNDVPFTLTYTPTAATINRGETETFTYRIYNPNGDRIASATLTFDLEANPLYTPTLGALTQSGATNTIDFSRVSDFTPYTLDRLTITISAFPIDDDITNITSLLTFASGNVTVSDDGAIFTVNGPTVTFTTQPGQEFSGYQFMYTATNPDGLSSSGNLDIVIVPQRSPLAVDNTITVNPGQSSAIHFGSLVYDGSLSAFDQLAISLNLIDPTSNANILEYITFNSSDGSLGPDNTNPITFIRTPADVRNHVEFEVLDTALPGTYNLSYIVSDGVAASADTTANITFNITPSPLADTIRVTAAPGDTSTIDFTGVAESSDTIILDTTDDVASYSAPSSLFTIVNFNEDDISDVDADGDPLTRALTGLTLRFTVPDDNSIPQGLHSIPYTVFGADDNNKSATQGYLQFLIVERPQLNELSATYDVSSGDRPTFRVTLDETALSTLLGASANGITSDQLQNLNAAEAILVDTPNDNLGVVDIVAGEAGQSYILVYTPYPSFDGVDTFVFTAHVNGQTGIGEITFNTDKLSLPPATVPLYLSLIQGYTSNLIFTSIVDGDLITPPEDLTFKITDDATSNPANFFDQLTDTSGLTRVGSTNEYTVDESRRTVITVDENAVTGNYTLSYTATDGESTSSTSTITLVIMSQSPTQFDTAIDAIDLEVGSPSLPTYTRTFTNDEISDYVNAGSNGISADAISSLELSLVNTTGSDGGVASFAGFTLTYTPTVDFAGAGGSETFLYSIYDNTRNIIGTTILTFDVEQRPTPTEFGASIDDHTLAVTRSDLPTFSVTFTNDEVLDLVNSDTNNISSASSLFLSITGADDSNDAVASFAGFTLTLAYDPSTDFVSIGETETFTYSIYDNISNQIGTGTLTFNLEALPSQEQFDPAIDNLTFNVGRADLPTFTVTLTNDEILDLVNADANGISFAPSIQLSLTGDTGSDGGVVSFTGFTLTYDPADDFANDGGRETFGYRIHDTISNQIGIGTLTFNITPRLPLAQFVTPVDDHTIAISQDTNLSNLDFTFTNSDVADLINAKSNEVLDSEISSIVLTIVDETGNRGGTATFDGFILKYVRPDFTGLGTGDVIETFTYRVSIGDSSVLLGTGVITFKLNTPPLAPDIMITLGTSLNDRNVETTYYPVSFGAVTDDVDSFSDLSISLPNTVTENAEVELVRAFNNTGNVPSDAYTFDETHELITIHAECFTGRTHSIFGAPAGQSLTFPYTVVDTNGATSNGIFTVNFVSGFNRGTTGNFGMCPDLPADGSSNDSGPNGGGVSGQGSESPQSHRSPHTQSPQQLSRDDLTNTLPASSDVTPICSSEIVKHFDLGEIGVNTISKVSAMVIANTGNTNITQLEIMADDWTRDDSGESIIPVGQTRYSLTKTDSYYDRTPFTGTMTSLGQGISENDDDGLSVYVQVLPEFIDGQESYRGAMTQNITVSPICE